MKIFFLISAASFFMVTTVLIVVAIVRKDSPSTPREKKTPTISSRDLWLAQARVNLTARQFWFATLSCALFTFVIVSAFSRTPLVAGALSIGAAGIPYLFISKKRAAISRELINAWPDALRDISATISSGHSLSFALHTLSQVGPDCIAPHMTRFAILERTMGFRAALETIREEMNDATTDRILEVLIVAQERGGRVVKDIIDNLIEATTEDIALAETIASESVEMKINSRAVVVLPWIVLLLLTLSGGVFREFYQSTAGAVVILAGAALSALGIAILTRLTRNELEARVFKSTRTTS